MKVYCTMGRHPWDERLKGIAVKKADDHTLVAFCGQSVLAVQKPGTFDQWLQRIMEHPGFSREEKAS